MSWGERSCKKPCRNNFCNPSTCNVDCPHYVWDGITEKDSVSDKDDNVGQRSKYYAFMKMKERLPYL